VPIRYYARSREEGKKLTWTDGLQAVGTLIRLRLTPQQQLYGRNLDHDYHCQRQSELAEQHPLRTRPPRGSRSH
jgi:hypothetical protein